MGNPESLAEESHEDGLLEYPVYTKPAAWRGREVPEVLLSGDHGAIAAWRHAESVRRTVARRPDLAHPAAQVALGGLDLEVRLATRADAGELFTLHPGLLAPGAAGRTRASSIPALEESFEDALRGLEDWTTFVAAGRRTDRRLDPRRSSATARCGTSAA